MSTWHSDYWHSRGETAYDADDLAIPPTCPVCDSPQVEAVYGPTGDVIGRHCTDEAQHRAALATPEGQRAAAERGMEY